MQKKVFKKQMTIEDLARMVAKGFENTSSKDNTATKQDIADLENKIEKLRVELKAEIQGLRNSVNNYLKLTDKRYLELKHDQKVLAKYLKIVIEKSKMKIDLKELENVLK